MDRSEWAGRILLGTSLEEKLLSPALVSSSSVDFEAFARGFRTPESPGRPSTLKVGKAPPFPVGRQFENPRSRGHALHYFANHELLALEVMALVLLKFPDAPEAFLQGICRTMADEQRHLSLYLKQMKVLGVEFGELPVNDYFWRVLSRVSSPVDFVVQMSLTFEQANLDFACFFRSQAKLVEDCATADILETVLLDEIAHVRHGLNWFKTWKAPELTDWDAYLRLLPEPLTPARGKSSLFFDRASRLAAGLDPFFVDQMELYGGSRGRPPVLWHYNPMVESEVAHSKGAYQSSDREEQIASRLESLLLFLGRQEDILIARKPLDQSFLRVWHDLGAHFPATQADFESKRLHLSGLEPWGWSPQAWKRFHLEIARLRPVSGANASWLMQEEIKAKLANNEFKELHSKLWTGDFLKQWLDQQGDPVKELFGWDFLGSNFECWEKLEQAATEKLGMGLPILLKAPFSSSGRGVRLVRTPSEWHEAPLRGWARRILADQGGLRLEPYYTKVIELSQQLRISKGRTQLMGVRTFATGPQSQYLGTYLGQPLPTRASPEIRQFFYKKDGALDHWSQMCRALGDRLTEKGYEGHCGVDAILWRDSTGDLRFKGLSELNLRWTMGAVALALEDYIKPGSEAVWAWQWGQEKFRQFQSSAGIEDRLSHALKVDSTSQKIASGVVSTLPSCGQGDATIFAHLIVGAGAGRYLEP